MDKVKEILRLLEDLRKVWHDDTELGYLCEMYRDYLNKGEKE